MLIEGDYQEEEGGEILLNSKEEAVESLAVMSICAMDDSPSPKILRLLGHVNKMSVSILLDTGSTHNFINVWVVQRTGILVTPEPSFAVTVAGEEKLQTEGLCRAVHIQCQGRDIITDFHILSIGGCQMVLGVDWLQTLDEMTFSYKNQSVRIVKGNNSWELQGVQSRQLELVQAEIMDRSLYQCYKGWVLYICNKDEIHQSMEEITSPQLKKLCEEFSAVFDGVKGLHPPRSHDHKIPLIPMASPVNIRPYRHPWEQKNVIEKMIEEMLEQA